MIRLFKIIPLFAVLLAIYNILAFSSTGILNTIIREFPLPSGKVWSPTYADLLVMIGVGLLYFEIFKSTQISDKQIIEHFFSFILFLVFLLEFLFVDRVGQSSFLFLCLMAGLDIVAGFTISISAGRRDISISGYH